MRHCLAVLEALGVGELRRGLAVLARGGGRGQRGAPEALRGGQRVVGRDEAADPGAHLVEDVGPGAPALAAERGGLLLVHLQIAGEAELLGEQPAEAPVPPALERAARELGGQRRRRPGAPERPLGGRGGDGLDLAGEAGEALPQAHEVALLPLAAPAALEGGQVVPQRPRRQEPRLLDVLQDGGHGDTKRGGRRRRGAS
uniref:Uncharacterized protein n=1 Tax=Triticum urartu TaxID=4572 RepID=A0A8R7UTR6_TRIUA